MKIKFINYPSVLLIAVIAIGLTSCVGKAPTQDEIVRANAEEYVMSVINDPTSYEFVNLVLVDSVLFRDNVKYRKDYFKEDIEKQERYKTVISIYNDANIEKSKKILSKIDSLEVLMGDKVNDVASFTYIYSFRANNAMGAKVLKDYFLQTGAAPDYKVINLTDEREKVYNNPEEFPGYREMMNEMY